MKKSVILIFSLVIYINIVLRHNNLQICEFSAGCENKSLTYRRKCQFGRQKKSQPVSD